MNRALSDMLRQFESLRKTVQGLRERTIAMSATIDSAGKNRDIADFNRDSALFIYNAEQLGTLAKQIVEAIKDAETIKTKAVA